MSRKGAPILATIVPVLAGLLLPGCHRGSGDGFWPTENQRRNLSDQTIPIGATSSTDRLRAGEWNDAVGAWKYEAGSR